MTCHNCKIAAAKKFGKFGPQRQSSATAANNASKTFSESMKDESRLGDMRISLDKAEMCLEAHA